MDIGYLIYRAGFTMEQMGQLPRAPTNSTKLRGPLHKDNEIDMFRIVDFLKFGNFWPL